MKYKKLILGVIILAVLAIVAVRVISGEDGWICSEGKWIPHGRPTPLMPTTVCN